MDLLLAWGLLRPIGPDQVLLPREVALRLRGGRLVRQPVPTQVPAWQAPTSATGASLPASLVDRAAIGSAQELTSHVVAVLDDIAARTPRALATGGVPKREMGTFTRLVDDARLAEFVIGITRGAGLFTTRGGLLMPTTGLDDFLDLDAFARWLLVRDAWRSLTWWPADLDAAGRAPAEEMTGSSASSRAASQRAAGQRPTGQPEPGPMATHPPIRACPPRRHCVRQRGTSSSPPPAVLPLSPTRWPRDCRGAIRRGWESIGPASPANWSARPNGWA